MQIGHNIPINVTKTQPEVKKPLVCKCGQKIKTRNFQGLAMTVYMETPHVDKKGNRVAGDPIARVFVSITNSNPVCRACVKSALTSAVAPLLDAESIV